MTAKDKCPDYLTEIIIMMMRAGTKDRDLIRNLLIKTARGLPEPEAKA